MGFILGSGNFPIIVFWLGYWGWILSGLIVCILIQLENKKKINDKKNE